MVAGQERWCRRMGTIQLLGTRASSQVNAASASASRSQDTRSTSSHKQTHTSCSTQTGIRSDSKTWRKWQHFYPEASCECYLETQTSTSRSRIQTSATESRNQAASSIRSKTSSGSFDGSQEGWFAQSPRWANGPCGCDGKAGTTKWQLIETLKFYSDSRLPTHCNQACKQVL